MLEDGQRVEDAGAYVVGTEATMNGWFGPEMRGTPYSENQPELPVPEGQNCSYCGTVICSWDSGDCMPLVGARGYVQRLYRHQECIMYSVLGSRWCRSEGVELKTPQHKRYHELQRAAYGIMRPRAIERRILLEFSEFVDEDELINNWRQKV